MFPEAPHAPIVDHNFLLPTVKFQYPRQEAAHIFIPCDWFASFDKTFGSLSISIPCFCLTIQSTGLGEANPDWGWPLRAVTVPLCLRLTVLCIWLAQSSDSNESLSIKYTSVTRPHAFFDPSAWRAAPQRWTLLWLSHRLIHTPSESRCIIQSVWIGLVIICTDLGQCILVWIYSCSLTNAFHSFFMFALRRHLTYKLHALTTYFNF